MRTRRTVVLVGRAEKHLWSRCCCSEVDGAVSLVRVALQITERRTSDSSMDWHASTANAPKDRTHRERDCSPVHRIGGHRTLKLIGDVSGKRMVGSGTPRSRLSSTASKNKTLARLGDELVVPCARLGLIDIDRILPPHGGTRMLRSRGNLPALAYRPSAPLWPTRGKSRTCLSHRPLAPEVHHPFHAGSCEPLDDAGRVARTPHELRRGMVCACAQTPRWFS